MSRWTRGQPPPDTEPVAQVPEQHRFAIALQDGAAEFVVAMRRHPRNHWPETHVIRGAPKGAQARVEGATWALVRSSRSDRQAAIREATALAVDLGLAPVGFAPLDAVTDPPSGWLEDHLAPWSVDVANDTRTPLPRGLSSVAGLGAVRRLIGRVADPSVGADVRHAAARLLGHVVANTGGLDGPQAVAELITSHLLVDDTDQGPVLLVATLEGMKAPARLAAQGLRDQLPSLPWLALLAKGSAAAVVAAELHAATGLAPTPDVAHRLVAMAASAGASEDDSASTVATLAALSVPHANADVLRLAEALIEVHRTGPVLRAAVAVQCAHLGDAASPGWRVLAPSLAVEDLAELERLLHRHGTARDVPDAVQVAHRMLRRRLMADGDPPLGGPLLMFLSRHRGNVDVDAVFIELDARWSRLPSDIRAHLIVRGVRNG